MTCKSLTLAVALGIAATVGATAHAEEPAAKISGAFTDGYEGLRDGMLDAYETARKGTVEKWHDVTGKIGTATNGPSAALTADVQRELIAAGYRPGAVDGRYGPMTNTAIRSYQFDNSLPQDGQISQALLDRLQTKRTATIGG